MTTVKELKDICREYKIKGYSKLNKKELISLIKKNHSIILDYIEYKSKKNESKSKHKMSRKLIKKRQKEELEKLPKNIEIQIKKQIKKTPKEISWNMKYHYGNIIYKNKFIITPEIKDGKIKLWYLNKISKTKFPDSIESWLLNGSYISINLKQGSIKEIIEFIVKQELYPYIRQM